VFRLRPSAACYRDEHVLSSLAAGKLSFALANGRFTFRVNSRTVVFGGGDHGAEKGGRLYCTSLATLILEVYYRHPLIYSEPEPEDDFSP